MRADTAAAPGRAGVPGAQAAALIDRFTGARVLVVGEAMLDVFLEGHPRGLCREAPAPVVVLDQRVETLGGAANAAVNLHALGAHVQLLTTAGDDAAGAALCRLLEAEGMDGGHVITRPGAETITKQRLLAEDQIIARLDTGTTTAQDAATEAAVLAHLDEALAATDIVLVSDYRAGLLTPGVRARLGAPDVPPLVVDSHEPALFGDLRPLAVKPNYEEAVRLLGTTPVRGEGARLHQLQQAAPVLFERTGAQVVVVTLDRDGALLLERGRPPFRTFSEPVPQRRTTGAGDTFAAAFTLALAAGAPPPLAVELGASAPAEAVAGEGTAVCSAEQLRARTAGLAKLVDASVVADLADHHRRQGRQVVFTNGCFDLLHQGHVSCLSRAKAFGDVLVVAVNSDRSVRAVKGDDRPVCPLPERLRVLAALSCVDHLVVFDDPRPLDLVQAIRPDVFVKGEAHAASAAAEADLVRSLGGRVELLPHVPEASSSNLIERIRGADGDRFAPTLAQV